MIQVKVKKPYSHFKKDLGEKMKARQMKPDEWLKNETVDQVSLIELPFSVNDIESITELRFDEYQEDGLGTCYSCFVQLNEQDAHFKGHLERNQKELGVVVEMHAHEKHPNLLIKNVCEFLNIEQIDLKWISEFTTKPKFIVYRVDDNGNEFEMESFHVEYMANWYALKFQSKGHKQIYLVKNIT